MTVRTATVRRETGETQVEITINLDGRGRAQVETGVGFLDHMLSALARHARFDLTVRATGDLQVDEHHTVEDVGMTLGMALGEGTGCLRCASRSAFSSPVNAGRPRTML